MNEREDLLARWSRRKREVAEEVEKAPVLPAGREQTANDDQSLEQKSAEPPNEPLFDPTTLPPIESISAGTDIRGFLAPGVPAELTRAALRRAWAADPAIRDFVGLADYAWDFHAPGAMAGFGPLEMTDALRREIEGMLTRGQDHEASNEPNSAPPEFVEQPSGDIGVHRASAPCQIESFEEAGPGHDEAADREVKAESGKNAAAQYQAAGRAQQQAAVQRRHGGALPKA
jgi:hypothetical protein